MKNFGKVRSAERPQEVTITDSMVYIASNITPYTEQIDNYEFSGYEYDYVSYTKDEYIQHLSAENAQAISKLEEELQAAKILLGVE